MIGRTLATAIVAFTALTAPAQATVHHGIGTDPAGDSTSSSVDIVEAGVMLPLSRWKLAWCEPGVPAMTTYGAPHPLLPLVPITAA